MDDGKPESPEIVRAVFTAFHLAEVAELVDALASGASDRKVVGVRVPSSAKFKDKNQIRTRSENLLRILAPNTWLNLSREVPK